MDFDFRSPYSREAYCLFLSKLFGMGNFRRVDKPLLLDDISTKFLYLKRVQILGLISGLDDLDEPLLVLEITHGSQRDARVSLTKELFKLLSLREIMGIRHAQALVILRTEGGDIYRFSLFTTSYDKTAGYKKILSNPQRQSFLLGKGEKVRTAEIQFQDPVKNFKDLIDRFKIEVVRDKFFNNYLELYIQLYREIIKDSEFKKNLEGEKIDIVSFTKTLLGKIIFLYFIQKKGWLGVEKNGKWGEGNKDFMRWLWDNRSHITFEKTGNFYNDCLEHLFYDGLNSPSRIYNDDYDLNFQCKIPYLNGGLFKADYDFEKFEAKILNDIFSNREKTGILDVFDTYNFTIDEDDLYDKEVAIDPEMLGKIFEKMIAIDSGNIDKILTIYEEKKKKAKNGYINMDIENWNVGNNNKKLGAFYTPREIVHYMTRESLIAYLVNNLKGKKEENEEKIRKLFDLKEQFLVSKQEITEEIFDKLTSIVTEVDELLKKVKVLDPAIGSGAFPMGLLHEIATIRYYIYEVFYETFLLIPSQGGEQSSDNEIRGSKISMYKIKRDVIQNNIYGVDISAGAIDIARLRFWLSLVVDEENPEPLPNFEFKFVCANTLIPLEEIKEQKQTELDGAKELNPETLKKYMNSYYNSQTNKDKEEWKIKIEKFLGIYKGPGGFGKNIVLDLFGTKSERTKQLETYEPFNSNHSAEFFDPSLMMGNSKFDIVIGNPPYITYKGKEIVNVDNNFIKKILNIYKNSAEYKINSYALFIEHGMNILNKNGFLSFIIPGTILQNQYLKNIRKFLLENSKINTIVGFGNKVFDAITDSIILNLEKTYKNNYLIKYIRKNDLDFSNNEEIFFEQDKFKENEEYSILLKTGNKEEILLDKISNNFMLEDFFYVKIGIKRANAPISSNKVDNNYEKFIVGGNLSKFIIKTSNFILFDKKLFHTTIDEKIFLQEKLLVRKTGNILICSYDNQQYFTDQSIYNLYLKDGINNISLKFIMSLLNSRLLNYYFNKKMITNADIFPYIKGIHLKQMPIKQISLEEQKPFIEKVDQILEITKKPLYNPKEVPEEQKKLEKEIDEMVYALYGLSEEEVRVVEESLG